MTYQPVEQKDEKDEKRQRRKRDRYRKIPLKIKLIFYQKVIHEEANFVEVARKLGLNYSTAKTLARNYKGVPEEHNQDLMTRICESFDQCAGSRQRSSYREVRAGEWHAGLQFTLQPIEIVCNNIKMES